MIRDALRVALKALDLKLLVKDDVASPLLQHLFQIPKMNWH